MAKKSRRQRKSMRVRAAAGSTASPKIRDVLGGVIGIIANTMAIWSGMSDPMKASIKTALGTIVGRFMTRTANMLPDEQIVQAAKLIIVLRVMNASLGKTAPPAFANGLTEQDFIDELVRAAWDGMGVSEENLPHMFDNVRCKWELSSTLPVH